jgi:hypothetical protein
VTAAHTKFLADRKQRFEQRRRLAGDPARVQTQNRGPAYRNDRRLHRSHSGTRSNRDLQRDCRASPDSVGRRSC